jgi:hypothetical protein
MVVVAMIWMYFCFLFFLYGGYLNKYFKPVNIVLVYPKKKRAEMQGIIDDNQESALFGSSLRKPLGHENDDVRNEEVREEIDKEQDYLE